MAIYSLRHTPIGRSTQSRPHTASAHIGYISRPQAARHFMAARMPEKPKEAANYLKQMEDGDRANARVADKIMLALPKELNQEQRVELVRGFANDVTKGKASWLAAIHDKGKDAANPHSHLLIRDRCPNSGKRVIGMSEAGSTEMLRAKWEQHANRALELAGHDVRIDRRSLQAQGIDRTPTIHEGPNVRAMEKRGARPRSRLRDRRNGRGARRSMRQVDYPSIDRGQTRPEYNRALRSPETEADYWNAVDQDTQRRDFEERGLGADYRGAQKAGPRPASVHDISRLSPQPQQSEEVGGVLPLDSPLSVPSSLPGNAVGIDASPARLEPSPQRVAGRQGHDEAADKFGIGSRGATGGLESPKFGDVEEHGQRSVEGVGRLPVQTQQRDQASGVPLLDSPLSVPSRLPADTVGFGASPARFQPTSQGVAGREGKNEAADHFTDRPIGAKFGQKLSKAGKVKEHGQPSVHGVCRLPLEPHEFDKLVARPHFRSPLGVPASLPGSPVGLGASKGAFKPAAERIGGRQGHDESTDQFSVRPIGATLGGQSPKLSNVEEHTDTIGQNTQNSKGASMSDTDEAFMKGLQDRVNNARLEAAESRGRFDDLMKRSYLDPVGAEKAMDKYRALHGDQALYDRMNRPTLGSPTGHGMKFGRRPGSIAAPDGYSEGAGQRRQDSLNPRRDLADATKKMHEDRERLSAARQAMENQRPQAPAPQQQRPEPQPAAHQPQPQPARSAQPHPGQQHKGLEQMGQPSGPAPARPGPDRSRMSPEARQAGQQRGLEQPHPRPPSPRAQPHPGQQHKGLEQAGQPKGPAPAEPGPDMSLMSPEARPAHQHRGLEQPQRPSPRSTQPSMPAAAAPPALPGPAGATAPLTRPEMAPPPGQAGGKAPAPSVAPKKRGMEM